MRRKKLKKLSIDEAARTFRVSLILSLVVFQISFGQKRPNMDTINYLISPIGDDLYWNGELYSLNRSFLSCFDDYEDIYPQLRAVGWEEGIFGKPPGTYYPEWVIYRGVLYLRNIQFKASDYAVERVFKTREAPYEIMECLTGGKFQMDDSSLRRESPSGSFLGSMRADWVNGVFYAKKPYGWGESFLFWNWRPFYRLTFKSGKLLFWEVVFPELRY